VFHPWLKKISNSCDSPSGSRGAVLVKGGKIIGRGWHRRAGGF
jgi:pyrimidine deaminase RibD-like protein